MVVFFDTSLNFFQQKDICSLIKNIPRNRQYIFIELGFEGWDATKNHLHFQPLSRFFFEKIKSLLGNGIPSTIAQQQQGKYIHESLPICISKQRNIQAKISTDAFEMDGTNCQCEKLHFPLFDLLFVRGIKQEVQENFFRILLVNNKPLTNQQFNYVIHSMFLFIFDVYKMKGITFKKIKK